MIDVVLSVVAFVQRMDISKQHPGLRLAWQGAPQKGVRISRVARETGKSTEPQCAGVTAGRPAPDHFLISRAHRKILSPFWGARMYSLA